jgi:hypothetical protein
MLPLHLPFESKAKAQNLSLTTKYHEFSYPRPLAICFAVHRLAFAVGAGRAKKLTT